MHESPWFIPMLFLCAAALSVILLIAGSILTLWCQYITRTGKPPLGSLPGIEAIRSAFRRGDDDEDEPPAPPARPRTGP